MKQSSGGRLATLRYLAHRFAFFALVVASFGLMILGKADTVLIERTRALVVDAAAPILDALARPAGSVADVLQGVRELAHLRAENARLREENARLMRWQTVARRLDQENRALAAQVNLVPYPDAAFVTARVIADPGGAFLHSLLIGAGSRDGVRKGQAVLAGEVLVGRVAEVGARSARILLLTDINSRLPVTVENGRQRAVLVGDNTDRPRLGYLSSGGEVSPGDRVVTSGHGGAFPPGLPVGVVASATETQARVEPFVHRHALDVVTLVDYGLAGIIGEQDRPGR